jgi:hypothetical protein
MNPLQKASTSTVDAVHLPKIHPKLILCSKAGSQMLSGKDVANITVAGESTVQFLKHHPSAYRAYVIASDTHDMSYRRFVDIFERSSSLLHKALQNRYWVALSCYAGINRSVTTILIFVIRFTNKPWKTMRDYIRMQNKIVRRLPALSNSTFEKFIARYAREH